MSSMTQRRRIQLDDPVGPGVPPTSDQSADADPHRALRVLALDDVSPNPDQPRQRFDDHELASLADSIRERGVLQPIIVRPDHEDRFVIVAGERRWRAARLADLTDIPALIQSDIDDADAIEIALIENMARTDLTPIEEARTVATLLDDLDITAGALAQRLGRSRTDIAHTTRLLELPDEAIALIHDGVLTKGHGKALLAEPDHTRRRALARACAQHGWSVRALEAQIKNRDSNRQRQEPHPDQTAVAERLELALTRAAGIDATARPLRGGFQIILDQDAAERLRELLDGCDSWRPGAVPRGTPL